VTELKIARRRSLSKIWTAVGASLLAIAGGLALNASQAEAAGGSVTVTLYYNTETSQYDYKCVGTGFHPVRTRTWTCRLESADGVEQESHSDTFKDTYFRTRLFDFKRTNTVMCVVGTATGGASDRKCN
jgi:hypothetical protein